ncbi:exonuclease V subunit alpha [compost metagenome]
MASVFVLGEDKTRQIRDWTIHWSDKHQELVLTCHFPSGKAFSRPLSDCRVEPTRELKDMLRSKKGSALAKPVQKALIYGEKFAAVQYPGASRIYVEKLEDIELIPQAPLKSGSVFQYFASVASARAEAASGDQREVAANVTRQLDRLPSRAGTALHAYCTGINARQEAVGDLIYPFGVNESQLMAVERAFEAQVSVIEGPPGTGKTQTILNIIANILLRGQTVAILSNNNAAVANVFEKLGKSGLDYLVARLGSKQNREDFFADLPAVPAGDAEPAPAMESLQATMAQLKQYLTAQNTVARLKAEIDEVAVERRYLRQWQQENGIQAGGFKARLNLSPPKTADLMAYLARLGDRRIGLRNRLDLMFNFKIFRAKPFGDPQRRQAAMHALQMQYYDKLLQQKEAELAACEAPLVLGNSKGLLDGLTAGSMKYLKSHLHRHVRDTGEFDLDTYRRNFDSFLKRFPILTSSTHSIVNSIETGALLDYVIIDEASQQDIVPGILALGCAKNAVIVGDSKQLAHIPAGVAVPAPADEYDCEKYSLLDSSIGVFKESLPKTLLKEHYRCHARIIQFCNQQFYGNELIPMNSDTSDGALRLVVTARGNHSRGNTNLRELDSLMRILEAPGSEGVWQREDGRGFIAPFRAQVDLSRSHLPSDFLRDTVHKFQGRECEEIVFSTVLDKKRESVARIEFVDDARMVNVAVSRAQKRFTLVTGDEVFTASNGPIAALIRYMEYYADGNQVVRAPVVSAFDLLYGEYDRSLERLAARLQQRDSAFQSERIVAQLLRDAISDPSCLALTFHAQVALNQVAATSNTAMTARERAFLSQGASCDFVIYFKVGKAPLGVIEVDGGSHEAVVQAERDALKDSILDKSGIAVLRLRTVESRIEERIAQFLSSWASRNAG